MSSSSRQKYPRTPHLPWSPGATSDDVAWCNTSHFEGRQVVVTEKMDGENTTMYRDYIHARSIDSRHHSSRSWVKALQQRIGFQIPEGWRLCGENLYAKHSIFYGALPSYFMLFSLWDEHNRCLDWTQTCEWAALLDLHLPKVCYEGPWDEALIASLPVDTTKSEGYVVRLASSFDFEEFDQSVAKFVRANHVVTDQHWMQQAVVPNLLANS